MKKWDFSLGGGPLKKSPLPLDIDRNMLRFDGLVWIPRFQHLFLTPRWSLDFVFKGPAPKLKSHFFIFFSIPPFLLWIKEWKNTQDNFYHETCSFHYPLMDSSRGDFIFIITHIIFPHETNNSLHSYCYLIQIPPKYKFLYSMSC